MNFEVSKIIREDGYGSWNTTTQSWSGVVGQVANGNADLGVAEFSITNRRLEAVDFTLPLIVARTQLYIKEPSGSVQWYAYFEAFTWKIWMSIIVIIITTPILLTVIKMKAGANSLPDLFFENYLYVWGIFCQQGLAEFPDETPMRIALFSIFVSALVVSAAYSASLISFLTLSTVSLPFSTMEGFAESKGYRLIVLQNSSDYDLFSTTTDPVLMKMRSLMKPWHELPRNLINGFKDVCANKVAFYTNEAMVKAKNPYMPCDIVQIDSGRTDSLAMIMAADSPYTGVVNYHIQRFQDNGMINRLRNKYLIKPNPSKTTYDQVGFGGVAPILSVLAGGIIIAIGVFLCEKLYSPVLGCLRKKGKVNLQRTKKRMSLEYHGKKQISKQNLLSPVPLPVGCQNNLHYSP